MESLRKITGTKMRRRIGMYGDGCIIGELEDVDVGEDGLYGSSGTGRACIAMMMY